LDQPSNSQGKPALAGRVEAETFDDFRRLATEPSLSRHERIGFPDSYREGFEPAIFRDILAKLPALADDGLRVLDIGPGCGGLADLIIAHCDAHGHGLTLVDSAEMLAHIPDAPFIRKIAGRFPEEASGGLALSDRFDVIICYSVLHYVFAEGALDRFVDAVIGRLAEGAACLLGDIPNVSRRKRFFSSSAGVRFHQEFMNTSEPPDVSAIETGGKIDDAVLLALLARARSAGCDAYLVPQPHDLPMANRREDVLLVRP
jgi:SAM-dependent methyltransferase